MAFDASLPKNQQSTVNVLGNRPTNIEEDQENQQPGAVPMGAPGMAPAAGTGMAPSDAQNQPPKPSGQSAPRSGMFSNLRAYIDANRPGSRQMGQFASQQAQRRVDRGQKSIEDSESQFRQAATSSLGRFATEEGRQQEIQNIQKRTQQAAGQLPENNQSEYDDAKFAQAVNLQYQGPRSLEEAGLYGRVRSNLQDLDKLRQQTQSREGTQQYLRDVFGGRGDYTRGESKLDNILFGSDARNLQDLQQATEGVQDLDRAFSEVQEGTRGFASELGQTAQDFRSQARGTFQNIAGTRQSEIDDRLSQVVENWDQLPEYFRNIFREAEQNRSGAQLGTLEAETLGVQAGEGLYNILDEMGAEGLIRSTEADKARLVSQQEQQQLARLQALADLAQGSEGIDFRNVYTDPTLAGTQTALDALDLSGVRDVLSGAEQDFRDYATGADVVGYGQGRARYSRGLFRGRGTVHKSAREAANLRQLLEGAGYDFESEVPQTQANTELLKDIARLQANTNVDTLNISNPETFADKLAGIAGEDSALFEVLGAPQLAKILTPGGQLSTAGDIAQMVGGGVTDASEGLQRAIFGSDKSLLGDVTLGGAELLGNITSEIGRGLGNLATNIFGGGKGRARRQAQAQAQAQARQNLQRNIEGTLDRTGFSRRIGVGDTDQTTARQQALLDILANIDRTNL